MCLLIHFGGGDGRASRIGEKTEHGLDQVVLREFEWDLICFICSDSSRQYAWYEQGSGTNIHGCKHALLHLHFF